jgi:hypothetical protein
MAQAKISKEQVGLLDLNNIEGSVIITEAEGISSNDNDTSIPTSAAVKDYVDSNSTDPEQIQDLISTFLQAGPGISLDYDDAGNTLTISAQIDNIDGGVAGVNAGSGPNIDGGVA